MLNYILSTSQDESKPKSAQLLIQELIQAFPEEPERGSVMTFAQQLKQEGLQEGLQQGFERGKHAEALVIAKSLRKQNVPWSIIASSTGISEEELELEGI